MKRYINQEITERRKIKQQEESSSFFVPTKQIKATRNISSKSKFE